MSIGESESSVNSIGPLEDLAVLRAEKKELKKAESKAQETYNAARASSNNELAAKEALKQATATLETCKRRIAALEKKQREQAKADAAVTTEPASDFSKLLNEYRPLGMDADTPRYSYEELIRHAADEQGKGYGGKFIKRWILVCGDLHWIRTYVDGHLVMRGPFTTRQLDKAIREHLAALPEGYFEWAVVDAFTGRPRAKTISEIVGELGTTLEGVIYDMRGQNPTGYDPTAHKLRIAICKLREELKPVCHVGVMMWLAQLFAADLEKGFAWIGSLPDLTRAQAALVLFGAAGAGKDMLAMGLARLWWTLDAYVSANDALSHFAMDRMANPLIVAAEARPVDRTGKPITTERLREVISALFRSAEGKFVARVDIEGAQKWLFVSNDRPLIDVSDENLGSNDLAALTARLIMIRVSPDVSRWLEEMGGWRLTKDWVSADMIAETVLWIREQLLSGKPLPWTGKPFEPGKRFLVEGRAATSADDLIFSGTVPRVVAQAIGRLVAKCVEAPAGIDECVIFAENGSIFVSSQAMHNSWPEILRGATIPSLQRINAALRLISGTELPVRKPKRAGKERPQYWELRSERWRALAKYAESQGVATTEDFEVFEAGWAEIKPGDLKDQRSEAIARFRTILRRAAA